MRISDWSSDVCSSDLDIVRQFDPGAMLAAIDGMKPSLLTLTPTMLQMLLDHPAAASTDFSSIRLTLYAGSPISLGLIKRAIATMPGEFMQFYGRSEEHTSELQSLMRISYAVFCLKK